MEDTAQANQNQVQDQTSSIPSVQTTPAVEVQGQGVGSVQKEQAPLASVEGVTPSEVEPTIQKEVAEAGVEIVSEEPQVSKQAQQAGIQLVKESTPVVAQPTGLVQLPFTEEEAEKIVKVHKRISDSIVWLAMLVLKQFKQIHRKITS